MDPAVLADPYPLYKKLRETDPVHWDPYLHAWVVTGYQDCIAVLHKFSADRTPNPDQIKAMGIEQLAPVAQVMTKQMLFMDAPTHTRLRKLCSVAFTSRRIETMRAHIAEIAQTLIARALPKGKIDLIADFAAPLPVIVTAEMLGVPTEDHEQLKS
jgi:hypothetical protein